MLSAWGSGIPFFAELGLGARGEQTSALHAGAFDVIGPADFARVAAGGLKLDRGRPVGQSPLAF